MIVLYHIWLSSIDGIRLLLNVMIYCSDASVCFFPLQGWGRQGGRVAVSRCYHADKHGHYPAMRILLRVAVRMVLALHAFVLYRLGGEIMGSCYFVHFHDLLTAYWLFFFRIQLPDAFCCPSCLSGSALIGCSVPSLRCTA